MVDKLIGLLHFLLARLKSLVGHGFHIDLAHFSVKALAYFARFGMEHQTAMENVVGGQKTVHGLRQKLQIHGIVQLH